MKNKLFIRQIPLHVYGGHNVNLIIHEDLEESVEWIRKRYNADINDPSGGDSNGKYITLHGAESALFFIVIPPDASLRVIVHESLHATWGIFTHLGIAIDEQHDENQAYLIEYLVDEIIKHLNKYHEKLGPQSKRNWADVPEDSLDEPEVSQIEITPGPYGTGDYMPCVYSRNVGATGSFADPTTTFEFQ